RLLDVAARHAIEPMVGAPYLSIARWLREFEGWPDERRRAWQEHRLETVIEGAATSVPFYRSLLGRGRRLRRLQNLPVVEKALIRMDMDAFRADGWRGKGYVEKATAGTTGDPWRYQLDKRAWAHIYGAQLRAWERTGYRYGDRIVVLGTPPSLVPGGGSTKARLRAAVERRTYAAAGIEVDRSSSLHRVRRALEARGVLWYGYAGMVTAMGEVVADAGPLVGPTAIVTTSEPLPAEWRQRIEHGFDAPVVDEYGCNDGGVLAASCAEGRFHVAENVSLVEILDGDDPCPPGVEGDIVVTNLHAEVLPFLRYRVGDRGVLGDGPCPCGLPGLTLARLAGRIGDRIKLPDGREIQFSTFGPIFWETPSVRRWQIVQRERRRVKVRLEVDPTFSTREAEHVRSGMVARVGTGVEVDIVTSEPIERTTAGKLKVLISSVS
ncbi:MAG: phenylacetate--CoA ligase family protein, partial [Gaiellaceae bacterium]